MLREKTQINQEVKWLCLIRIVLLFLEVLTYFDYDSSMTIKAEIKALAKEIGISKIGLRRQITLIIWKSHCVLLWKRGAIQDLNIKS